MWHHAAAYAGHYHRPYYASHAVADHGGWLMHTCPQVIKIARGHFKP